MAERLTRSRLQVGGVPPGAIDPGTTILRLLNEAKQDAIAVLQVGACGPHKLLEACAKLREGSAQFQKIVGEDLRQAEDLPRGGLARSPTPRLPPSQVAKAAASLLDACHVAVRAVIEQCDSSAAAAAAAAADASGAQIHLIKQEEGAPTAPTPPDSVVPPATSPAPTAALTPAQLWKCAVDAAHALQDATRLLAEPSIYTSYTTSSDPSCEALLAVGELAAAAMQRATSATRAAIAAAAAASSAGSLMEAAGKQQQRQPQPQQQGVPPLPDAVCLLAAHACSLLLGACEQQAEGLLDALQDQPAGRQRLHTLVTAALDLAAARITETAHCDAAAAPSQPLSPLPASSCNPEVPSGALTSAAAAAAASSCSPPAGPSYQLRQLQAVSLRFAELLVDDGGTKAAARRALLPALGEALRAEPRRFLAWWCCGRDAILSGLSLPELLSAPQLGSAPAPASATTALGLNPSPTTPPTLTASSSSSSSCSTAAPTLPPAPDCISTQEPKLQAAAVGMLLKSPASRSICLSLLLACARQPAPAGTPGGPFGEGFNAERFMAWGEGEERELLYVGGRGRGYKRRKVLNPEAHGVETERVGVVLAAMAGAVEAAVLLCKILVNTALGPQLLADGEVEEEEGGEEGEEADGGAAAAGGKAASQLTGAVKARKETEEGAGGGKQPDLPLAEAFWQQLVSSQQQQQSSSPEVAVAAKMMGRMAANLAALLSVLQPLSASSGQVRDAVRQAGLPSMRWPRLTIRLPVFVVAEDSELLLSLMRDMQAIAADPARPGRHAARSHPTELAAAPGQPRGGGKQQLRRGDAGEMRMQEEEE
ncbi:hypothetical protein Agub_g10125, partial [Astrephomene gubernaculifera]